jgi:hypothetical protein
MYREPFYGREKITAILKDMDSGSTGMAIEVLFSL